MLHVRLALRKNDVKQELLVRTSASISDQRSESMWSFPIDFHVPVYFKSLNVTEWKQREIPMRANCSQNIATALLKYTNITAFSKEISAWKHFSLEWKGFSGKRFAKLFRHLRSGTVSVFCAIARCSVTSAWRSRHVHVCWRRDTLEAAVSRI